MSAYIKTMYDKFDYHETDDWESRFPGEEYYPKKVYFQDSDADFHRKASDESSILSDLSNPEVENFEWKDDDQPYDSDDQSSIKSDDSYLAALQYLKKKSSETDDGDTKDLLIQNFKQLTPFIYSGGLPNSRNFGSTLNYFKKLGITKVISFSTQHDTESNQAEQRRKHNENKIDWEYVEIPDLYSLDEVTHEEYLNNKQDYFLAAQKIAKYYQEGEKVFFHCGSGNGRSSVVSAIVLLIIGEVRSTEDAVLKVRELSTSSFECSSEMLIIEDFIRDGAEIDPTNRSETLELFWKARPEQVADSTLTLKNMDRYLPT